MKPGDFPISIQSIWRYIAASDKLIDESCKVSRKRVLRNHLAKRRNLYAKAVNAGDISTALAVAKDEAALRGLYPEKQVKMKVGGDPNNPLPPANVITIYRTIERFEDEAETVLESEVQTTRDPSRNGHL